MRNSKKYYAMSTEGVVDINAGVQGYTSGGRYASGNKNHANNGGNKKKIAIIVCIAVAVVAMLGAGGFFLFNSFINKQQEEEQKDLPFTFTDKTVISGIDVTGKTLEQAKQLLNQDTKKLNKPIEISIDVDGEVKSLNQDNFTYTYNIDEVVQQAYKDAIDPEKKIKEDETRTYTVTSTVQEQSITDNVTNIANETNSDPEDAYVSAFHPFEENRFEYTDEKNGRKLNSEDLTAKLKSTFKSGGNFCKLEADVETLEPDVTTDFLKNNLIELASYETYSTNTENGTTNMTVALKACNGSVIGTYGDDIWSFNDCTGDSNKEENGYKSAKVISEGKLIDGIGGGICQASSTIYNAAIRANLEIEERYCHQWASQYVPTGLDATIDYPNLDLKLSNPNKTQVFLECKVDGSTLHAAFWGVKYGDYDEIKTHNEIDSTGSSSYTVRAWRVYLKDGQEIDREELGKSTYDTDKGITFIDADYDTGVVYNQEKNNSSSSDDSGGDDDDDDDYSEYQSSEESSQSSESSSSQSSEVSSEVSQEQSSEQTEELQAETE